MYSATLYDEDERIQKPFKEMIGDKYKVRLLTYISDEQNKPDILTLYSDVDLTKGATEEPVVVDFRKAAEDESKIIPTNAQQASNNKKTVPNPPTGVEGIAVALGASTVIAGALLISSKKKKK